jgi:hypothetical protein
MPGLLINIHAARGSTAKPKSLALHVTLFALISLGRLQKVFRGASSNPTQRRKSP